VRILLDTMAWLWSVGQVECLNKVARDLLVDPQHEVYFSAASVWEIAIKAEAGKLRLPESPRTLVPRETARQGLRPLPVSQIHALGTYDLPNHHRDPFDRILVAQAIQERLVVLTSDRVLEKYPVEVIWCGK
jgi:PIN domain nuclease of toxin-antitoxin system